MCYNIEEVIGMKDLRKIAIVYDFDSTLISGNMQNADLIPYFGISSSEFWEGSNKLMKEKDMDEVLAYMYYFLDIAKLKKKKMTKALLEECGKKIVSFYPGVVDWFARINEYGKAIGVEIEHYVISCGYQEMVEASCIAKYIKKVFASRYMYNDKGEAVWPAYVVNYTQKMQYLARIEKNLTDKLYESGPINTLIKKSEKYIPYSRMIYIGDGCTDVPSMKMVRSQGGYGICVYDKSSKHGLVMADQLTKEKRVDVTVEADYSEGSELDVAIKKMLKKMR
ncbi:MAG: haloacid dehalogenase-like hydrolase [Clostridiales bacterium]|nr:haloacid dehalogenase-like hydrolase [Clostridiales bacterium]